MPVYAYQGFAEGGKQVKGIVDADNPRGLRNQLKRDGVFLTGFTEESTKKEAGLSQEVSLERIRGRVSTADVAIMTRLLATLVGAGIPLVQSLVALADQLDHPTLKRIIGQVKTRVNEGATLADAMSDHPKVFSTIFVNMVRAGESAGALEAVLVRLADFTESQAELRQKISSALMYPAIMVVIGVAILGILMTVVVPKVTQMFDDIGATLPFTTRALIWSADIAKNYWWALILLAVLGYLGFRAWVRTQRGRERWDRFMLTVIVFGKVNRMIAMARFARTLATLLVSGVPILEALDIVRNVVNNVVLANVIDEAREAIEEGHDISTPLKRSGEFPPLVYHMVAIGEQSGRLEEMLVNIAKAYEGQVNNKIQGLTSLLEPVMIVAMGGIVAFIVFSILMPILQLNTMIQ